MKPLKFMLTSILGLALCAACGGDGDGFAIGTAHTIHAMRRNVNITYILMNPCNRTIFHFLT